MQLWGTGHVIRPWILRMRTNLAMFSFPVYYICVEVYVISVWFRARPWFQLPATPLSTDLKIENVRRGTHWQRSWIQHGRLYCTFNFVVGNNLNIYESRDDWVTSDVISIKWQTKLLF